MNTDEEKNALLLDEFKNIAAIPRGSYHTKAISDYCKEQGEKAGLECGILLEKLPHLDCVAMGPDMENIHSPGERLNLPSFYRTYRYLKAILKKLK